jgi:hypothetical protein
MQTVFEIDCRRQTAVQRALLDVGRSMFNRFSFDGIAHKQVHKG